jgi:hypothetical protein
VHRAQFAGLEQLVDLRAADAEVLGDLWDAIEQFVIHGTPPMLSLRDIWHWDASWCSAAAELVAMSAVPVQGAPIEAFKQSVRHGSSGPTFARSLIFDMPEHSGGDRLGTAG